MDGYLVVVVFCKLEAYGLLELKLLVVCRNSVEYWVCLLLLAETRGKNKKWLTPGRVPPMKTEMRRGREEGGVWFV